jgi:hypothetical protein
MKRWRLGLITAAAATTVAVVGCSQAPAPPSASSPPASAESSAGQAANLPPGCELIELRNPSGEVVTLDGIWIQEGQGNARPMTWWVETFGDCFWATGIADDYDYGEDASATLADAVQSVRGTIRDDFTVIGAAVLLAPHDCVCLPQRFADVTFDIVLDDAGGITLEEDREEGVADPRCLDPPSQCLAPLVLRPGP